MKTELRFYSGIHTIGGVVMSLQYGQDRILLEIGCAYDPANDYNDGIIEKRNRHALKDDLLLNQVPAVEGLYSRADLQDYPLLSAEESSLNTAVLISHLHLDHMSAVGWVAPSIPVYMSEPCQRLEQALDDLQMGSNPQGRPFTDMKDRCPIHVGAITITPYLLCEESYQDWSFYVETPDLKLHYTGDLMMHGSYRETVMREMKEVASKKPDILVCEATTFMDSTMKMVYGNVKLPVKPDANLPQGMLDKAGLIASMQSILQQQQGLCAVNFYEREMADVLLFEQMAQECGRTLVYEPQTAWLIRQFFHRPTAVLIPDCDLSLMAQSSWYPQLLKECTIISKEQIRQNPANWMIQNSYPHLLELLSFTDCQGTYLHAGGMPIGAYDPAFATLQRVLRLAHFQHITFFAKNYFNHAYPGQVQYYVNQIDAKVLIPSHSSNPERLAAPVGRQQLIPELNAVYVMDKDHLVKKEDRNNEH